MMAFNVGKRTEEDVWTCEKLGTDNVKVKTHKMNVIQCINKK